MGDQSRVRMRWIQPENAMRLILAGSVLMLTLAACKQRGGEQATTRKDTVVTAKQTVDTAVVTTDTTVKVDTNKKSGKQPIKVDTVRR
jgi:hypothetical protein